MINNSTKGKTKNLLPEFYSIHQGPQIMYVLGARHSYDPNHPQFKEINQYWKKFLSEPNLINSIVLIEGGERPRSKTIKKAITSNGEAGYMTYLGWKAGIKTISPEPNESVEIKKLRKKFSQDEIMYYYFARMAAQWQRSDRSFDFDSYVSLQRYRPITGWQDYNFSHERFIQMHNEQNNHTFDREHCSECLIGYNSSSWVVADGSSKIRDSYIFKQIKKFWDEGKNLFIIFGTWHTRNLKNRLKKLGEIEEVREPFSYQIHT